MVNSVEYVIYISILFEILFSKSYVGMTMGQGGDGFCLPQIQTHIVRVFPKLIPIPSGDKKYNPKLKPNGDRVSQRGSGIPVIPLPT
jgi:hypothetical protein